jgi:hypothetical protein
MKKTIGLTVLLLTSGAALLSPATALARDRNDHYYGDHRDSNYEQRRREERAYRERLERLRRAERRGPSQFSYGREHLRYSNGYAGWGYYDEHGRFFRR